MVTKTFVVVLAVAQAAFGQIIGGGSSVYGNSVVDNIINIGGGGVSGIGLGSGLGSGSIGYGAGLGAGSIGLGAGLGFGSSSIGVPSISAATLAPLSGYNVIASGPLAVTTISPIGPSGLAVASENALAGNLAVSGQLPFLSAVAFEGALPTAGSGVATCGCGSGSVGIVSEGFPASVGPTYGIGSGFGGVYF